jgi:DNA-binding FadR family transcriptional regulator
LFHLTVFKRLENPFVMGILEAYWDAYEAVELNRYADYTYLQQVWTYHEQIFEAICAGNYEQAKSLFIAHTNLIRFQPRMQRLHSASEPEDE